MAALSRKFFVHLAHGLRDIRPPEEAAQLRAVWLHCVTTTAGSIMLQSAQFNPERFYEAAGLNEAELTNAS